jgi:undecaprenyl phosphate N,N'-diacetylbacillosamine 1-phosphate transferase
MYKNHIKRLLDIIVSIILLIITSPIIIVVALLLYLQNWGNPIFTQIRPGHHLKHFKIYKFKTMYDLRDQKGELLPDNQRITLCGKYVRLLSLDELPQLLNVLLGNMSIVGPRPLLIEYIPLYTDEQRRRHDVKPGITGLAQINGRNRITWEKRFEYDIHYVDNVSFMMDVRIIYQTIMIVLKKDGINQSENRPMTPYKGVNKK